MLAENSSFVDLFYVKNKSDITRSGIQEWGVILPTKTTKNKMNMEKSCSIRFGGL